MKFFLQKKGLCYDCAVDIWKKTGECYLCRKEIIKIYQIDLKGGNKQYKPIIKLANLKKEIIEESIIENENEEIEHDPDIQENSVANNEENSPENDQNISNAEIDNKILRYLEQQNN